MYYILDNDKKIVKATDKEYTEFLQNPDAKRVALDEINGSRISTVFLGLDHRYGGEGPPILFETMVFGGPLDMEQDRCCTWDQAEMMHTMMVEMARNSQ